jgi:F-type H+-transporting ATPase subunit a
MHESIILPTFGLHAYTAVMIYIIIALTAVSIFMSRKFTLVPGKFQSVLELIVDLFTGLLDETVGHKGRAYLPFILTFAIFILVSNFMGLIPGLLPPTSNLNTTFGLSIIVFLATHYVGVKEHGVKYFKHFMGPVWWLAPLIIPIEIIGHLARPASLALRLFGNMMGHEQIDGVLLILMPVAYPLLLLTSVLGIIVFLIQAFIFSLLSMMYLGGAVEDSH